MAIELSNTDRARFTRVGLPLVVSAIGVLYLLTMPRVITLEDAGIFQMVCHLGGISHPPGYPLFTGLCQQLAFGESPLSSNLMSFYFAIGAIVVLYFVVLELGADALVALLAATAYGLTRCLWSQAIIVEVYSLAAFQFLLCWFLLLRFANTGQLKYWYGLCLCVGLALSNHWPLFILSCLGFVSVLWMYKARFFSLIQAPTIAISALLLLVGLSPYLLLFQSDPTIALYGEVGKSNFIPYVLREYYDDNHVGARPSDKLQYLGWMLPLSVEQLGIVALPVVLLGLVLTPKKIGLSHFVSLALIYIGSTFVLVSLLGFRFEPQFKGVFLPYPVIAMAAYSVWFAIGAGWLFQRLKDIRFAFGVVMIALVLGSILLSNYFVNDRSTSRLADEYGRIVLNSMPQNALLLVGGDNQIGPIGYLNRVAGLRPDVLVQSVEGLLFSDNMIHLRMSHEERLDLLRAFKAETGRRIFTLEQLDQRDLDYGLYYEFEGEGDKRVFLPAIGHFADYLIQIYEADAIRDSHEIVLLHTLLVDLSRLYSEEAVFDGVASMTESDQRRLGQLQATLPGKMSALRTLTVVNPMAEEVLAFAFSVEDDLSQSIAKQNDAVVYEYIGRLLLARGDKAGAEAYFQRSVKMYPTAENLALCEYVALSDELRRSEVLSELDLDASNCLKEEG